MKLSDSCLCRPFSNMAIFFACLLIISHGIHSGAGGTASPSTIQGSTWEVGLWCPLPEVLTENGVGRACASDQRGNHSLQTTNARNVTECHLTSFSHFPLFTKTHNSRAAHLNILCRIDQTLGNLICNLKWLSNPLGTGVLSASLWDVPSGLGSECEGGMREEDGAVRCSLASHALDDALTLTVSVSSCRDVVQSPPMCVVPRRLLTLDPPVNLRYNMTAAGHVRLSWTAPQSESDAFSCDIRYISETSGQVLLEVREASRPEADLIELSAGFNYTVQVRCMTLKDPGVWSAWSHPLYIYLHEVTYLPERLFVAAGSNVTVCCIFNNRSLHARNVVWWRNYQEKIPESQYSVVSERVSSVTILNVRPPRQRGYDILQCCQLWGGKSLCSYPYAQIYVTDFNIAISCETNGDLTFMTCRWNASQWAEVTFLYRNPGKYNLPCDMAVQEVGIHPAKECPVEGRGFNRCTLKNILPVSCYLMWLEVRKEEGIIKSRPITVTPMDLVKPHPPFDLSAVTEPDGFLSIKWKRPKLPVYGLQCEVRYMEESAGTHWKVARPVSNESALVAVSDPCLVYTVQVRCWRNGGPGYTSDWSVPCSSSVRNFRAPEQGPDFWRVLQEYPALNQTNVTLLLKPLPRGSPLFCVERFEVRHQTIDGAMWSENMGQASSYTFVWSEEVHSVTIVAINTLGSSARNAHMTLSRQAKAQLVQSFSSIVLNSSCAMLSWALVPDSHPPESFVVEWPGRGRARGWLHRESVNWVRVPPTTRSFYLHDTFFDSEEFHFVLYPIFMHGEGRPIYSKDAWEHRGREKAVYMLVVVIAFLSVVLFVTLSVSQRRMRKVVWKDVPNPSNCSWAQGVDFKKAETIENLFRHPEQVTSHPLLLESETISEVVIVEETESSARDEKKESPGHASCRDGAEIPEPEGLPLPGSSESSAQSRVAYATVLPLEALGLLYKQQESLSSFSDEGNFSANVSDISGSFPGGTWEPEHAQICRSHLHCSSVYNSAEEYSETSEQEEEPPEPLDRSNTTRNLCYLRMTSQEEGEEDDGEDEEELGAGLMSDDVLAPPSGQWQELPVESSPLLSARGSEWAGVAVSDAPLYMPQFRTALPKSLSILTHGTSQCGSRAL